MENLNQLNQAEQSGNQEEMSIICCNKCGKEYTYTKEDTFKNIPNLNKYHEIIITSGYGSKFDGETISFYLCDDCIEKLINSLRIKPQMESYLI